MKSAGFHAKWAKDQWSYFLVIGKRKFQVEGKSDMASSILTIGQGGSIKKIFKI